MLRKISEKEAQLTRAKSQNLSQSFRGRQAFLSGFVWRLLSRWESLRTKILNLKNPAPVYVLQKKRIRAAIAEQLFRLHSKQFCQMCIKGKITAQLNVDAYVKEFQLVPADWLLSFVAPTASYVDQEILEGWTRQRNQILVAFSRILSA